MDGGNPALFEAARQLRTLETRYRACASRIAIDLGEQLVPRPELSPRQRHAVLALRRSLHNGAAAPRSSCTETAKLAEILGPDGANLRAGLEQVASLSAVLADLSARLPGQIQAEEVRLARTPWELAQRFPMVRHLAREANPQAWADLEQRVARGEPWDGTRLRQRGEHLWRIIQRASTKTTPRGWLSHVALAWVDAAGVYPPGVSERLTVEWQENVFEQRRTRARLALAAADPATTLVIAPLHRADGEHVIFWVGDPDPAADGNINQVRLRRTAMLAAVMRVLGPGPATLAEVQAALAPAGSGNELEALRRFLTHLAGLGVVETSMPPERRFNRWHPSMVAPAHRSGPPRPRPLIPARSVPDGFLDVYRESAVPIAAATVRRLEYLVGQALRLTSAAANPARPSRLEGIGERPVPLLDLVAERIHSAEPGGAHHRHRRAGWPMPNQAGAPWARLLEWVGRRADQAAPVDLDEALLDALDMPHVAVEWPGDALLRPLPPGAGALAVLQSLGPAGTLDARFIQALEVLHGSVPHAEAYRRFLTALQAKAGATFVEVLVPPMNGFAANAVRRPRYVRKWTGDPDLRSYCDDGDCPEDYVPLDSITLRQDGDDLVAEARGTLVWPVQHATRTWQAPWHHLGGLLTRASPRPAAVFSSLPYALDAFPERTAMPRVTVGGELVISCAQWRAPAEPWAPDALLPDKVRALEGLRARLGLPRFVYLAASGGGPPQPCDLQSLRAIRAFEMGLRHDADLLIVEALPTADRLAVQSGADSGHAAELLLRFPYDESPESMAARVASSIARRPPQDPRTGSPEQVGEPVKERR